MEKSNMILNKLLLLIILLCCATYISHAQDIVKARDTIEITIDKFKEYLKPPGSDANYYETAITNKQQPVSTFVDVEELLRELVVPKDKGPFKNAEIEQWLKTNKTGDSKHLAQDEFSVKNKAVIFVHRQLDLSVFLGEEPKRKVLEDKYDELIEEKKTIEKQLTAYRSLRDLNAEDLVNINSLLNSTEGTSGEAITNSNSGGSSTTQNGQGATSVGNVQKVAELNEPEDNEDKNGGDQLGNAGEKTQLEIWQESLETLDSELNELKSDLAGLNKDRSNLEKFLKVPTITSDDKKELEADLADKKRKIRAKQNAIRGKAQEISDIKGEIKKQQEEQEAKEAMNQEMIAQKSDLITQTAQLNTLIKEGEERLKQKTEEMTKVKTEYEATFGKFQQKGAYQDILLNKRQGKQSDYLFDERQYLIVVMGDDAGIQGFDISVENRKGRFEETWNGVLDVARAQGILADGGEENTLLDSTAQDKLEPPKPSTIKLYFQLLDKEKVRVPSTITIAHDSLENDFKYEVHERVLAQFKIGVSGSTLDRKDFILDTDNNTYEVQIDSTDREEWKANAIVFLEFYPWGGLDYDALTPIWKEPFDQWYRRITPSVGIRLAKDPLQTIFLGGSLLLSKDLSLNAGFAMESTPRDMYPVQVDPEAALDILIEHTDRKYEPKFYIGLSFNPSFFGKTVGLID